MPKALEAVVPIVLGSAAGGLARHYLSAALTRRSGFPWGTFCVNLLGCLLVGVFLAWLDRPSVTRAERLLLTTGFCGAFTTFSTFMAETVHLWRAGAPGTAAAYGCLSLAGGVVLFLTGGWLVRPG